MFDHPPRGREWVSWLYVAACTLVIFATIPLARAIQELVSRYYGRSLFLDMVYVSVVLAAGAVLLALRRGGRPARDYIVVLGTAGLYAWFAYRLRDNPEEAFHFVEYGVLSVLLFRAFSHRVRDPAIYGAVLLGGALIGTLDEVIQWYTPRRVFEFRDVRLNVGAVLLAQVAIAGGLRPGLVRLPVRPASARLLCRLGAALLILIGLCLSNTPRAIEAYIRVLPFLGYVAEKDHVMSEYGYRYRDPEIGEFKSRLPPARLAEEDRRRAAEAAAVLGRYADSRTYQDFLRTYTPVTDPFLHEARVHLFRRDHYLAVAWKHEMNEESYRYHLAVAYRENQILEKYFGHTLRASVYELPEEQVGFLSLRASEDFAYRSAVSAGLITSFRLWQAWLTIGFLLVVLAAADLYYGRRRATPAGGDGS